MLIAIQSELRRVLQDDISIHLPRRSTADYTGYHIDSPCKSTAIAVKSDFAASLNVDNTASRQSSFIAPVECLIKAKNAIVDHIAFDGIGISYDLALVHSYAYSSTVIPI